MSQKQYDNSNTAILHVNNRKTQENHPGYSGSGEVVCPGCKVKTDYWLSAYLNDVKEGSKIPGKKYFKISFKPKEAKPAAKAARAPEPEPEPEEESDRPF